MSDRICILEPTGFLDTAGGVRLRQEVSTALDAGAAIVLIDMEKITFMDSSGLGALVAVFQRVRAANAKLYLCSLDVQIKIVLELTRMDAVFNILPDRYAFDSLTES